MPSISKSINGGNVMKIRNKIKTIFLLFTIADLFFGFVIEIASPQDETYEKMRITEDKKFQYKFN